jgi:exoribonuclease R
LRINKKNRQDGYVRREGGDENDIFIPGIKNQNRALEGDVVVVKLLIGEDLERGFILLDC